MRIDRIVLVSVPDRVIHMKNISMVPDTGATLNADVNA
jgi:hypothetical protein